MADLPLAGCRLVDLVVKGDERGSLIAIERATGLPFDIERAYFIYDTLPGVARGFHAHYRLRQWLINVAGTCVIKLDDGFRQIDVHLDRPNLALEVGPQIWHEMHDFLDLSAATTELAEPLGEAAQRVSGSAIRVGFGDAEPAWLASIDQALDIVVIEERPGLEVEPRRRQRRTIGKKALARTRRGVAIFGQGKDRRQRRLAGELFHDGR